jgi:hypothetical protein
MFHLTDLPQNLTFSPLLRVLTKNKSDALRGYFWRENCSPFSIWSGKNQRVNHSATGTHTDIIEQKSLFEKLISEFGLPSHSDKSYI